jgi:hypothetical protein
VKLKIRQHTWHAKDEVPRPGALIQSDRRQFFVAAEDLYRVSDALVEIAETYDKNNEKETP